MHKQKYTPLHTFILLIGVIIYCCNLYSITDTYAATSKLNTTSVTLSTYHTYQLKVSHAKKVKWSSSNPAIATVSKKGLVTANAAGTAKISAKSDGKKFTCKITVLAFDRHIERAAYGKKVIRSLIGSDAVLSDFRAGSFMNGTEFSYFQCSYEDQDLHPKTCYVYIYPQEESSSQQLNISTKLYGNLVVKIDSLEMERMMHDRSQRISKSDISKCLSILTKTERITYHAGSSFKEIHSWMNL